MNEDCTDYLAALREEFPHFGILRDPRNGIWIALRGRNLELTASDGPMLREHLLAATGRT